VGVKGLTRSVPRLTSRWSNKVPKASQHDQTTARDYGMLKGWAVLD